MRLTKFLCIMLICIALIMSTVITFVLKRDEKRVILKPVEEEKAFILETKGDKTLNFRQACAVESLALLNPDLPIHVLFVYGYFDDTTATLRTLQQHYKNVHLAHVSLEDYVAGTPLES